MKAGLSMVVRGVALFTLSASFAYGTQEVCNVRWDKKRDEYSCENRG